MTEVDTNTDSPPPGRFGFVIGLVRRLIEFGKQLAAAYQQPDAPAEARDGTNFGTDTIAIILARIARGLLRAQVLLERLQRCAARPEPKPRPSATAARPPAQRAARPAAAPRGAAIVPDPDNLPTAEQIAEEDSRRPIGAVLVEIACDLGILPCHDLWRDLAQALREHRGNLVALFDDSFIRTFSEPRCEAGLRLMFPKRFPPAAPATGPP